MQLNAILFESAAARDGCMGAKRMLDPLYSSALGVGSSAASRRHFAASTSSHSKCAPIFPDVAADDSTDALHGYSINYDDLLGQGSYAAVFTASRVQSPSAEDHAEPTTSPPLSTSSDSAVSSDSAELSDSTEDFLARAPLIACKRVDKFLLFSREERAALAREVNLVRPLRHPSLIRLLDVRESLQHVYIMMELGGRASLADFLHMIPGGRIPEDMARFIFRKIIDGVAFLHRQGLLHCDIKPANILLDDRFVESLKAPSSFEDSKMTTPATDQVEDDAPTPMFDIEDEPDSPSYVMPPGMSSPLPRVIDSDIYERQDWDVRICDFGVTHEIFPQPKGVMVGTNGYMAPEVVAKQPFSCPADMYSCGALLYEMLCGMPPFAHGQMGRLHFPDDVPLSSEVKEVIAGLLMQAPVRRFHSNKVLRHAWMKKSQL